MHHRWSVPARAAVSMMQQSPLSRALGGSLLAISPFYPKAETRALAFDRALLITPSIDWIPEAPIVLRVVVDEIFLRLTIARSHLCLNAPQTRSAARTQIAPLAMSSLVVWYSFCRRPLTSNLPQL